VALDRFGRDSAQQQLGSMLVAGEGVPVGLAMARQWWERAAAGGNAEALGCSTG
jgi:TPR repeat protein